MKRITCISGNVFFDDGSFKNISLVLPTTATDHDWEDLFSEVIGQAVIIARAES